MEKWSRFTVIMVISVLVLSSMYIHKSSQTKQLDQDIMLMKLQLESIRVEQQTVEYLLDLLEEYQAEVIRLREMLDSIGIDIFEVTGYAPLDPNAIEGMCYSGDPTVTASGAKVEIGTTIAADTNVLPFGSRVWIDGIGWREVQDRGGMIKGNKIDVAVETRSDAFEIGRKERVVVYQLTGGN